MLRKILVVDDEPLFCEIMSDFLTRNGFNVTSAFSGDQALEAYREHRPDIVLLDVRMPGKDGLEVLREIKDLNPDAKVMMVTAVLDEDIADQALAEGAFDYITKPVNLHSLELALKMKLGLLPPMRSVVKGSQGRDGEHPRMIKKVVKSEEEWKELLTQEQFEVCRKKGTERPFSGEYSDCKDEGLYQCVCCGNDLFSSETKFDSGTGWPSFWAPISPESTVTEDDHSLFHRRVEVLCSVCDSHLGHVFNDGPPPTNQRYCINSVALKLVKGS